MGMEESCSLMQHMATPRVVGALHELEVAHAQSPIYNQVHQVFFHDLDLQNVLGTGQFTVLTRVEWKRPGDEQPDKKTYVMKALSAGQIHRLSSPNNHGTSRLAEAASELFREATLLAHCSHPNVISLHGVAVEGLAGSLAFDLAQRQGGTRASYGYYIILDLMTETLEQRLDIWRHASPTRFQFGKGQITRVTRRTLSGSPTNMGGSSGRSSPTHVSGAANTSSLLAGDSMDRLAVATAVADALTYIHSKDIVFRDLSPENIGFFPDPHSGDYVVKLFDFGMARTIKDYYMETIMAANKRYLAPENMICQPSGPPEDIYSFGILLWELATLGKPYEEFFTMDKHTRKVVFAQGDFTKKVILNRQARPSCAAVSDSGTKRLIQECWCGNPEARPNASQVLWRLQESIKPRRQQRRSIKSFTVASTIRRSFGKARRSTSNPENSSRTSAATATATAKPPRRRTSFLNTLRRMSWSRDRLSQHAPQRRTTTTETPTGLEAAMLAVQDDPELQGLFDCGEDDAAAPPPSDIDGSASSSSLSLAEMRARLAQSSSSRSPPGGKDDLSKKKNMSDTDAKQRFTTPPKKPCEMSNSSMERSSPPQVAV
eukprot:Nitzschia sp. Nitz4//scaffold151_size53849//4211//6016//NITZ4_006712-RA/size53849-processed-gene-0.15-mRNA-1//1//CDS//3329537111//9217//frame0